MSEECRAWALGRFGNILGCFKERFTGVGEASHKEVLGGCS